MSQELPALPKRPASPFTSQLKELEQAFPDTDKHVRRAILVAATGNLENAFNGLLALTDDTIRPAPPPQAVRDQQLQLQRDEELARSIASRHRGGGAPPARSRYERSSPSSYDQQQDRGRAASNDDLGIDEIRDNIQKWGNEASKNIGSFFTTLRSRVQAEFQTEEPDEDYYGRVDPITNPNSNAQPRGTTRAEAYRQVRADRTRDNDSNHFIEMEEEPPSPPPKPSRPTGEKQRVNAFGDDKPARWEPLRSTAESDAFFIGESDEEVNSIDEDTPLATVAKEKSETSKQDDNVSKDTSKDTSKNTSEDTSEDTSKEPTKDSTKKSTDEPIDEPTDEPTKSTNDTASTDAKHTNTNSASDKETTDS